MFQDITFGKETLPKYVTSIDGKHFDDAFPPKRKKEKRYLLIPFVLEEAMMGGMEEVCCGIVGEQWSCFCSKTSYDCTVRDPRKKMWKYTDMVNGFYINNPVTGRAFPEPCLLKVAALRSPTFGDLLNDGEGKSLETWTSIFWHLTDKAKEADRVHGGLQGVHVALPTFDEKLATKASTAQVDGLVVNTNASYNKSVEVCKAVKHLVTLESISKVAGLEHELQAMASCTKALQETLKKASDFVVQLSEYLSKLGGPGMAAPGGGISICGISHVQSLLRSGHRLHSSGTSQDTQILLVN
jgi:hypothetical protein